MKTYNYKLFLFIPLVVVLFFGCSKKVDLSGKWVGTSKMGGEDFKLELILSQSEKNINASISLFRGNNLWQTHQLNGFIEGNTISLSGALSINGTLDGKKIRGKIETYDMEIEKANE